MRYIDRTGKKMHERGESRNIKSLGALTREATKAAEENGLAVLKTSHGPYRVIKASGLGGVCSEIFEDLEAVNKYLVSR